jgi:hypothetical protein
MRETCLYGSEGGEAKAFPTPIPVNLIYKKSGIHPQEENLFFAEETSREYCVKSLLKSMGIGLLNVRNGKNMGCNFLDIREFYFYLQGFSSRACIQKKTWGGRNGKSIKQQRAGTNERLLAGVQLPFGRHDLSQGQPAAQGALED